MVNIISKPWFPIVTASLMTLFFILYLQECSRPAVDNSVETENADLKERVAALNTRLAALDTAILHVRQKRSLDSLKYLHASSGLKTREMALVHKLKQANADIRVIADSLPRIARYVELADSTIAVKDSLYHQEVNHRIAQELSYSSEIAGLAEKYIKQVEVSSEYEARVQQLGNQNQRLAKRLERKRTWNGVWKGIAAGAVTAVVVITAVK